MKTLVIGTAFILTMLTASFANASFSSAADGNVDGSNTNCQSMPPPEPTGGGTRERLQAMQRCNEVQSREQQTPSTSPTEQPTPPSSEQQTPSTSPTEQPTPPSEVPSPSP